MRDRQREYQEYIDALLRAGEWLCQYSCPSCCADLHGRLPPGERPVVEDSVQCPYCERGHIRQVTASGSVWLRTRRGDPPRRMPSETVALYGTCDQPPVDYVLEHGEAAVPRGCRVCGCTDTDACIDADGEACWWVEDDLCSACARAEGVDVDALRAGAEADVRHVDVGAARGETIR